MISKYQKTFTVTIGSNEPVSEEELIQKMYELEIEFNTNNARLRMHTFENECEGGF